jgi:5'-3' exonuclease
LANQEQNNFEDELQKLFLAKIQHEANTLLGLKQMYSNQDEGAGKVNYYNTYFQIDPTTQVEDMWNILAYYAYGLKFVYEYYFQNLASWSWYYPYYFAPLLTDIQYYLGHLIAQGHTLADFQLDKPFEPFKQLLCILPKESADLLPENFRKYILTPDSILRNPVDFYPDQIETVTYGSIRSHEAIYMIPFLDQSVVPVCLSVDLSSL